MILDQNLSAKILLYLQIFVEAIRGSSFKSDIAIDNVVVTTQTRGTYCFCYILVFYYEKMKLTFHNNI